MKKVNLEIPDTNLYVKGWGLDTNGNRRIIVGFPNDKGFSIQTNGTLPETNRIIQSAIRELSDDELDVIGDEVVQYVKEFGSANVKSRLRISNWRLKAQHNKQNENKMKMIREDANINTVTPEQIGLIWDQYVGGNRPNLQRMKNDLKKIMSRDHVTFSDMVKDCHSDDYYAAGKFNTGYHRGEDNGRQSYAWGESKTASLLKRIIKEELQNIDEKFQDNEDNLQDAIDFAENTYDVYQQLERSYLPAVKRFVKRGTYDETKALKLMEYYWSVYCRPAYKRINKTDLKLSVSDRQKFAKYFLDILINDFDALK